MEEEEGWVPVPCWLAALRLGQYSDSFQRQQLRRLRDCQGLTDEALSRLGVALPGHRRRILLALHKAFPPPAAVPALEPAAVPTAVPAAVPAATPELPGGRPVPRKRHIFRHGASLQLARQGQQAQVGQAGQLDQVGQQSGLGQQSQLHQLCQPSQLHQLGQPGQQSQLDHLGQQGQLNQEGKPGQLGQQGQQSQLGQRGQLGQQSQLHQLGQPGQLGQQSQLHQLGQPGQLGQQSQLGQLGQLGQPTQLSQEGHQSQLDHLGQEGHQSQLDHLGQQGHQSQLDHLGQQGQLNQEGQPGQLDQPGQPGQLGQQGQLGQLNQLGQPGQQGQLGQPGQQGQLDQLGQPGQQGQLGQPGQQGQLGQPGQLNQLGQPGQQGQLDQLGQQDQLHQQDLVGQLEQLDLLGQLGHPGQLEQLGQPGQLDQPGQLCPPGLGQLDLEGDLDPECQLEPPSPTLPSRRPPGGGGGLPQPPPPIPPRLGCRPPLKFSPAPPPGGAWHPPAPPPGRARAPQQVPSPGAGARAGPPLPAKRHQLQAQGQAQKPSLAPSCPPLVPPRTLPPRSTPPQEEVPSPAREHSVPLPRARLPQVPSKPFLPEFDDSDYEDSAWGEDIGSPPGEMVDQEAAVPLLGRPRCQPGSSLCSEEELSEDPPEAAPSSCGANWGCPQPPPSTSLHGHGQQELSTTRAGWLDKTPPQGSYIYQRRWVELDPDHLRYFNSDKDAYSKRLIPVPSICRVASVGDQKFEVVTTRRSFLFRADSDAERQEWVRTLQQAVEESRSKAPEKAPPSCAPPSCAPQLAGKSGLLELRGFKHKVFVVVAGDRVFLYKNAEDHRLGIGITYIQMNVGNVREVERHGFDLTTPYRTFSFVADSEQERQEWVGALQQSVAEALCSREVAHRVWELEANRSCADCAAPWPDWASINLCVVICSRCAGEHRGLGPGITKVRSLKLDRKVWTEELLQLFHQLGNAVANQFWAANVPPSEAIGPSSSSQERRRFLSAKYREGKYRRYHPLFGNQEELNRALCVAVTTSDLAETQALLFCGAAASCASGDPECPTPLALAERSGQRLQMEFLLHNKTSESPRLEVGGTEEQPYLVPLPSVTHNGFLYKTPSMAKPIGERKGMEEFSRRWCTLQEGLLSYYESERSAAPNGEVRLQDVVCLASNPPHTHGLESTFEVYTESERLYLFGLESPEAARHWLHSLAKGLLPPGAEELLAVDFQRLGRLHYKGGLDLEQAREGWFALAGSELHLCPRDRQRHEPLQLRKLQELSIQGDNEVLVLVERRRTLYIQGERKLDFLGWVQAIQKAAGGSGDCLAEQQLTEADVPLLVDRCIDYITQCGLTSEGIYRKSGQNSKTTTLLQLLRRDARGVRLREGEQQLDDVANTLKRFFRDLPQGLFTSHWGQHWLRTSTLEDEEEKIQEYRRLLDALPTVNRATLKALINHLFRVQLFSGENQMTTHNLAIVFGPTLFQTDGKDYKAGRVVEDLISHYVKIFNVNEQEMKKQQDEIMAIMKLREAASSGTQQAGDFICTVYLEEKKTEAEQHIKIPAAMTAEELTLEILDRRKVVVKDKDYWSCFEVNQREEAERPLHYSEKVLPILHCLGTDSYLVVKKQTAMEGMLLYLASRVGDCKHGMMKFREERNLLGLGLSTGFHDRYFILSGSCLRLYKEVRSHKPEREWPVRSLRVYLGIKRKLRPPTCWGFTICCENEKQEKQQWYLCCDTQADLREWFAAFLQVQHDGSLWPSESSKGRTQRSQQDSRLGNLSLIPLRGSESDMRSSVAAMATDPLTLLRNV